MTQTVTSESDIRSVPSKTYHGICTSIEKTKNQSMGLEVTVKNDPDRRIRPLNLLESPTAQAKQSTLVAKTHVEKRVGNFSECCPEIPGRWPTCQTVYGGYEEFFYHPYSGTPGYNDLPDTNWQLDMRLKIKDASQNLGAHLVEMRDTARMFRDFAVGTRNAWRAFRGSRRRRRRLTPCDVAAWELTASYGIEPLISDLVDANNRLAQKLEDTLIRRLVVTKEKEHSVRTDYSSDASWKIKERAICYVEMEPNRSNFTAGNPLEVIWEGVPFSFVVDWGFSVGDYLSSLDALAGVKQLNGTLTRKLRFSMNMDKPIFYPDNVVVEPGSVDYHSHERSILTTIPMSELPSWEPSRSWRAVVHGLSLLTTLNHRCHP